MFEDGHSVRGELTEWWRFIRRESHVLKLHPELLFQQAANAPRATLPSREAELRHETQGARRSWMRWVNRPEYSSPCLMTLTGHGQTVSAIALIPDGGRLVSADRGGTLRLWRVEDGIELANFETGQKGIGALAVIPGGLLVAAASLTEIRVWNLEDGRLVCTLAEHEYDPESPWLLAVLRDYPGGPALFDGRTAWDAKTWAELFSLPLENGEVPVFLGADGKYAASGLRDGTVRVWDVAAGAVLGALDPGPRRILGFVGSPPHLRLVFRIQGNDDMVSLRDLEGTSPAVPLERTEGHLTVLAASPDGQRIVAGGGFGYEGSGRNLAVWSTETGEKLGVLGGHGGRVMAVAFGPDGRTIVSGSVDRTIRIWDSGVEKAAHGDLSPRGHRGPIVALAIDPARRRIVSASMDHDLRQWDLGRGEPVRAMSGHEGAVTDVAVVPTTGNFVSASLDGTVRVWHALTGGELRRFGQPPCELHAVTVTPDGKYVISGGREGRVVVWDIESGRRERTLPFGSRLGAVRAFPDSQRLALAGDGPVEIWDIDGGRKLNELIGHIEWVTRLAMSRDGRLLASAGTDNRVIVWILKPRANFSELQEPAWTFMDPAPGPFHGDPFGPCIAVAADGRHVVSGSLDGELRIWDRGGNLRHVLPAHLGYVLAVAVTEDGRHVVSGGWDGWVKVWAVETGELVCLMDAGEAIRSLAVVESSVVIGTTIGRVQLLELCNL